MGLSERMADKVQAAVDKELDRELKKDRRRKKSEPPIDQTELAGLCYFSASRFYGLEAGLAATTLRSILEVVERFLGSGAAESFEAAWQRWRATLPEETMRKLEAKYWPSGVCGQWTTE